MPSQRVKLRYNLKIFAIFLVLALILLISIFIFVDTKSGPVANQKDKLEKDKRGKKKEFINKPKPKPNPNTNPNPDSYSDYNDDTVMTEENSDDIRKLLQKLIKNRSLEEIKKMLDQPGPVYDGKYFIHIAVEADYTDLVDELIRRGCDFKIPTEDSVQALPVHYAAKLDSPALLKKLIELPGVDIEATDSNGETPLMYAVICDKIEVVKFLLQEKGADANRLISPKEPAKALPFDDPVHIKTILNTAISLNHSYLAKLLLENGANPNLRDSLGMNALHAAALYNRTELIDALIDKVDPQSKVAGNPRFPDYTALDISCCLNHKEFTESLQKKSNKLN